LAQRLPADYEEKIVRFHRFIIDHRKEHSYPLHLIANMDETMKAASKRENTDLAVIRGGLTSILQPLDVSLNKPFIDGVRKRWMQWMTDGIHEFTATRRQKKPSEEVICLWISQAWNEIPAELITASFL